MSESMELLVDYETYELNAVHIGTQQKSADMSSFIKEVRSDGLYLLDLAITDHRIRTIAAFISRYSVANVMVVSARQYGQRPARKFAEAIGALSAVGRFIPLEVLLTQCFGHTKSLTCSLLLTLRPINKPSEKPLVLEFQSLLFVMQITIYVM